MGGWNVSEAEGGVPVDVYSVVLSAAGLLLSTLMGGGGSLAVLLALFRSPRLTRHNYTLLLVFFFLALALDLVWAPLELLHLLTFHLSGRHPTSDLGVATFALYVFLLGCVALLLAAFCVENVLRMLHSFSPNLRRSWPLVVVIISPLLALMLALAAMGASINPELPPLQESYLVLDPVASRARITVLTLLIAAVLGGAGVVVAVGVAAVRRKRMLVRTSESFQSGQSQNSSSGPQALPPYVSDLQDGAGCSSDDLDLASTSQASPASQLSSTLPDILEPQLAPTTPTGNGSSSSPIRLCTMPPALISRGPNMLSVNMAQVLGRRRHTICQIGDSSTPQDPLVKAKQYNYIRKFSVDISALQAQLENPKLYKEAPFQSDQDLSMRQKQQERSKLKNPDDKPLLPLPNLGPPRIQIGIAGGDSGGGSVSSGLKLNLPPRPPVITVSEEVKEEEIAEEEEDESDDELGVHIQNCTSTRQAQYWPIANKEDLTSIPRLPITQPVDEDEEEESGERSRLRVPGPDEEDENKCKSSAKDKPTLSDNEQDFIKMTFLLAMIFFFCTFPLFLVEAMKSSLHLHTYLNISTCARALSAIQTIIYPHVVTCMDSVVHRAMGRLKASLSQACGPRDADFPHLTHDQPSSTTSQL